MLFEFVYKEILNQSEKLNTGIGLYGLYGMLSFQVGAVIRRQNKW